jgi:hypothetical protein
VNNLERNSMLRFGAAPDKAREMDLDHIFISRLKLLIVMTRAYLEGYPLGAVRKRTLVSNARYIAAESVDLEQLIPIRTDQPSKAGMGFDHVFYQRVKLLASMAQTIGKDFPMGEHRKTALLDNLNMICNALDFTSGVKKVEFLKVA